MADYSGPIFDGRAEITISDYVEEAKRAIAAEGQDMVVTRLKQVIRKPTPWYWTQITTEPRGNRLTITGESVIYHWWLEGKGSRNYPVTRFKGYHTFEITTPQLRVRAVGIAESILGPYMVRIGGGS